MSDELMRREWDLWRGGVCPRLEELGAVTQADLCSPVGLNETPGQQLLNVIRAWGEALVELRKAKEKKAAEDCPLCHVALVPMNYHPKSETCALSTIRIPVEPGLPLADLGKRPWPLRDATGALVDRSDE
jgi:hypothetical protein